MEEQTSNKFLLGIIGALVGAFIGAIPWILVYAFGNMIVAILSVLIAIASYYGYRITKAKIDKKLPVIVAISSIIAVTVSTFVIAPLIFLATDGYDASFANLSVIYSASEVRNAFIRDYVISLIFTALGISGIIANLNKQIKDGVSREDLKINLSNTQQLVTPEEMQMAKDVFLKYDAMNKINAVNKDDIMADLNSNVTEIRAIEIFNLLRNQRIIKKSKGKYYFSEKAQNSNVQKNGIIIGIVIVVILVTISIIIAVAASSNNKKSNKTNKDDSNSTVSLNNNEQTEEYESEHIIKDAKMKFIPKDDLLILTDNEITTYYGSQYTAYEIIALNKEGDRIVYCFIDSGDDIKDYSAKEYLNNMINTSEEFEVKTVDINGFKFEKTQLSFENNEKKYTEECYVYKVDDKFICFDYSYPAGEKSNFNQMIEKN